MTHVLKIFFLVSLFSLFVKCGTNKPTNKISLDISLIDSIIIMRDQPINHTVVHSPRQLSPFEIEKLCLDWNSCKSGELRKYTPLVDLTVYQKDKTVRHFRANGGDIKEDNDYSYTLGNDNYFYNLYNGLEPLDKE